MEYLWNLWPMLLCPLLMGPMMWLAMRMNRSQEMSRQADRNDPEIAAPVVVGAAAGDRLAALRAELQEIGAQQSAIAAQIERLSAEGTPAVRSDPIRTETMTRTRRNVEV